MSYQRELVLLWKLTEQLVTKLLFHLRRTASTFSLGFVICIQGQSGGDRKKDRHAKPGEKVLQGSEPRQTSKGWILKCGPNLHGHNHFSCLSGDISSSLLHIFVFMLHTSLRRSDAGGCHCWIIWWVWCGANRQHENYTLLQSNFLKYALRKQLVGILPLSEEGWVKQSSLSWRLKLKVFSNPLTIL